jgi:hypothetical protein
MTLRHLLVIDDEPEFGRFIAHAAEIGGYKAHLTISAEPFHGAMSRAAPGCGRAQERGAQGKRIAS